MSTKEIRINSLSGLARFRTCTVAHRSYRAAALCKYPKAVWITGDGPYALLAWCRALTVTLHATYWDALRASMPIDPRTGTGCGGKCHGAHEIVRLAKMEKAA
jgi:hypothetical protein